MGDVTILLGVILLDLSFKRKAPVSFSKKKVEEMFQSLLEVGMDYGLKVKRGKNKYRAI